MAAGSARPSASAARARKIWAVQMCKVCLAFLLVVPAWAVKRPVPPMAEGPGGFRSQSASRLVRLEERVEDQGDESSVGQPLRGDALLAAGAGDQSRPPAFMDPFASVPRGEIVPEMPCNRFYEAADLGKGQKCPELCPFWSEASRDEAFCQFKCVAKEFCGDTSIGVLAEAAVADEESGMCRHCRVEGCALCVHGADVCQQCKSGYTLLEDGSCYSVFTRINKVLLWFLSFLAFLAILWYIELRIRPSVNEEGVQEGLEFRSRAKLRQCPLHNTATQVNDQNTEENPNAPLVEDHGGARAELWPLSTNLMRDIAGGPGNALHFRFQAFWIAWALLAYLFWTWTATYFNPEILKLGFRQASTPQELCRVVEWGHSLQHESQFMKVAFCFFLYAYTFVAMVLFAGMQTNYYQASHSRASMKNFAACVSGLPRLKGNEPVESELTAWLTANTGQKVHGVSVGWDIPDNYEQLLDTLEQELDITRLPSGGKTAQRAAQAAAESSIQTPMEANGFRWQFFGMVDRYLLNKQGVDTAAKEISQEQLEKLVRDMETTEYGYAVFSNEEARDAAVIKMNEKGPVEWKGGQLQLSIVDVSPESVLWQNLASPKSGFFGYGYRITKAIVKICLVMIGWVLCFYIPYSKYMSSLQFESNDQDPSDFTAFVLTMIVLGGNTLVFAVCSNVAEACEFHFDEQREAFYCVSYFFAVLFNTLLDLVLTACISYSVMVNRRAHTFGGQLLVDLTSWREVFESYPIQRSVGINLKAYAFPSTFLLPFVLEPILMVWLPVHIFRLIVRSNRMMKGWRAEKALSFASNNDSSRYADILINITLGMLFLFVPGGFLKLALGALFFSHLWIYIYDHYRVLRCVPGFHICDDTIDKLALNLAAIPIGLVLVASLAKANCMDGGYCLEDRSAMTFYFQCFSVHCMIYYVAINWVVPSICAKPLPKCPESFLETAALTGQTWFSVNPAYCLRSKVLYKHDPPCGYYMPGKQHLLKPNPKANQHFKAEAPVAEEY